MVKIAIFNGYKITYSPAQMPTAQLLSLLQNAGEIRELEKQDRPLVVIMLGAPYDATLIKRADALIAAYEYTSLSVKTLLDALDENDFRGHLPVKL